MLDTWRGQTFSMGGEVLVAMNDNKNPPYSKRLAELLADPTIKTAGTSATGIRSIYVIAGSQSWTKAHEIEDSHAFLLLPPDGDPFLYDWSILAGHEPIHVIVADYMSKQDLLELARAMNRDGANRVYTPNGNGSADCHYTERGGREMQVIE